MLNSIEKKSNVIKVHFAGETIWMPLNSPLDVRETEIVDNVEIDSVISSSAPDYDAYTIYVTRKCNYSCSYCFVNRNARDSIVTIAELIDFIESRGKKKIQVRFFGGEPLLKLEDIKQWVYELEGLKECGYSVSYSIVTNASLLNAEVIDYLYLMKFIVILSHELNDTLQQNNRLASEKLQIKAKQNMQYLAKTKLVYRSTIRCMLEPNSEVTVLERFQYAVDDLGISGVQFDIPHVDIKSEHRFTSDTIDELKKQIEEVAIFYLQKLEKRDYRYLGLYNIDNLLKIWILKEKYIDYATCGFGINHFAIDVDGTIYPCQNFVGTVGFEIGNVHSGLNGKKFETDIEKHNVCRLCSARELCTKRCYSSNYIGTGDIYTPNNTQCEMKREFIAAAIYILYKLRQNEELFDDYYAMLKVKNRFLR